MTPSRTQGTNLVEISTIIGHEIVHGFDPSLKLGGHPLDFCQRRAIVPSDPTHGLHDCIPPSRIQPSRVSTKLADLPTRNCTVRTVIIPNSRPVQAEDEWRTYLKVPPQFISTSVTSAYLFATVSHERSRFVIMTFPPFWMPPLNRA